MMAEYNQKLDYDAFLDGLPSLTETHAGMIVVFHDRKPVEFFDDLAKAVRYGTETYGEQQFIAQEIKDEEPTVLSYSLAI